jgi:NAD(P)H-quinone oxidoreductase subunit 5
VAPTVAAHGPAGLVLPALVVAAFAAAFLAQSLLGTHAQRPRWRAAYVHLANGLYVNTYANRLVECLWPVRPARGSTLARSAT